MAIQVEDAAILELLKEPIKKQKKKVGGSGGQQQSPVLFSAEGVPFRRREEWGVAEVWMGWG